MKMNKFLFNIKKNIGLYAGILLVTPFLVNVLVNQKVSFKANEKFTFLFATNKVDNDKFASKFLDIFNDNGILSFDYYLDSPKSDIEFTSYVNNRVAICDIFVIPEEYFDKPFLGYSCVPFKTPDPDSKYNFGADDYLDTYAYKIKDKNEDVTSSNDFLNFELEQDYYIMISKYSYHYNNYISNDESLLKSVLESFGINE